MAILLINQPTGDKAVTSLSGKLTGLYHATVLRPILTTSLHQFMSPHGSRGIHAVEYFTVWSDSWALSDKRRAFLTPTLMQRVCIARND